MFLAAPTGSVAQPSIDLATFGNPRIKVVDYSELFKESKIIFDSLTIADLAAVYPNVPGYEPPFANLDPNEPLANNFDLTSYAYAISLLKPNEPIPDPDSNYGKYLRYLARKQVEAAGYNTNSSGGKEMIERIALWYWNSALVRFGPVLMLTIKRTGGECAGYLGVRAWRLPGSVDFVLYPCATSESQLISDFYELVRPAGIEPMADDPLVVMPTENKRWKILPDCESSAFDNREVFRTDGRYIVTLGSGNVYEVTGGSEDILANVFFMITLRYGEEGAKRGEPARLDLEPALFMGQRYCRPLSR